MMGAASAGITSQDVI